MDWVSFLTENDIPYVTMKKYTHKGVTLSAKEWANKLGISRDSFYQRVEDLSNQDAVFEPGYRRKPITKTQRHNSSKSRSYPSWHDMHRRCSKDSRKKHLYYDREITICDRWASFVNFLADMGERPIGMTLDRHPNKLGNYEPENCRWATPKQQARNLTTNRLISFEGQEWFTEDLALHLGIKYDTLRMRLWRGIPLKKSVEKTDLRKRRK